MFVISPACLHSHLPLVLDRLASLCVDKDAAVRSAVNKLFKFILPKIACSQIAPFFPVLSAHLCCAMTHIDDAIQTDCLTLVDLLLDHYPALVTSTHSNLLPNFIQMISSHTLTGNKAGSGRSLLVNPSSKLSSHKWRGKVLARLHRYVIFHSTFLFL